MELKFDIDTEFQSLLDCNTKPISIQVGGDLGDAFFISIDADNEIKEKAEKIGHRVQKAPFIIFDYLGCLYRKKESTPGKNWLKCNLHIFFSFKDIEFAFSKESGIYEDLILPFLQRTRRISIFKENATPDGQRINNSIPIGYQAYLPELENHGKMRWFDVSVTISDISAMQGSESLKTYAQNVGIILPDKDEYSFSEKSNMTKQYLDNPHRFEKYGLGDLALRQICAETVAFYHHICEVLDIPKRDPKNLGMSTGAIVGGLLNDWLCNKLGVDSEQLHTINKFAGSEGISEISKLTRKRGFIYAGMVDGGRCVREKTDHVRIGNLIDIDVDGCYGNGMKNQDYFVGFPNRYYNLSFKEFEKIIKKWGIPGGWIARISWENAPFKQDLLISKTAQAFSSWESVIKGWDNNEFEVDEDGKKAYVAQMVMLTSEVHQASLNHDLYQVLKSISSNKELKWIRDNAVIDSLLIYENRLKVNEPTDKMLDGFTESTDPDIIIEGSKEFVQISLADFISPLIKERKKYQKSDPINKFCKLVINTTYGVIASEFFSDMNRCVSNVIVGNNITARVRALVYLCSKGLNANMIITDGGVFDINEVNFFKRKSLDLLAGLYENELKGSDRKIFCNQNPLLGSYVDVSQYDFNRKNKDDLEFRKLVDTSAWEHLQEQFKGIDILDKNQFAFESKDVYQKLILHSKVDYLLQKFNGEKKVAFRGMPKVIVEKDGREVKTINPLVYDLFNAIENDTPLKIDIEDSQMLSMQDWSDGKKRDKKFPLLPHDQVTDNKSFYSHSPLYKRFRNMSEYKAFIRTYQRAKDKDDYETIHKLY